jgi:hypothetical protein
MREMAIEPVWYGMFSSWCASESGGDCVCSDFFVPSFLVEQSGGNEIFFL